MALTWNASTGATAYDVKRSTVNGSGYVVVSSPAVTNYTNTGLTNGTIYYFVVAAKNASGSSANSSQVSATPSGSTDTAQYNFEAGTQGWTFQTGGPITAVAQSTTQAYAGTHSLAVSVSTATGIGTLQVLGSTVPGGSVVTMRVWVPSTLTNASAAAWVQDGAFTWTGGS